MTDAPKKSLVQLAHLHAVNVEQTALFVDSKPLADGLKKTAEYLRTLTVDDGRPCNTDAFLAAAVNQFDDKWDLYEAIKHWVEGDWAGAINGINPETLK